jgi:hypothetical protein
MTPTDICDYANTRSELLGKKLKKMDFTHEIEEKQYTAKDTKMMAISAAMRELDMIKQKFCK